MAKSYRDPFYAKADKSVEAELGLPSGLLSSIRLKGERSNADQVSEAGARSVYQIIPATRDAVKRKYGVDAYAGPEQAAKAAGLLLKESLDRNGGNKAAAVAEYHGGTDRRNWGARTKAYISRVTGGGDPSSAGGGSTFDKVARDRAKENGPDMRKVWERRARVGKPGGMTVQDAAFFDQQNFVPPPGFENVVKPKQGYTLPVELIHAYNSRQMDDDPEAQAEIERLVRSGEAVLPKGMKLEKPKARSFTEGLGMGLRADLKGAAGLADMVTAPINVASRKVLDVLGVKGGSNTPFSSAATALSDAIGLPEAESPSEQRATALVEGGVQGLLTAGAGAALSGAKGVGGQVAKTLAASPLLDTASGAAAGYSQETARQAGAGPVGQFAAGLAGGFTPVGLAATAERAAARIRAPKTIAEVARDVPRAAVVDEAGNLTPEGQEIAARHNVTPEEVVRAYEKTPEETGWASNDSAQPSVAREATNDLPVEQVGETPPMRKADGPAPVQETVAPAPKPEAPPEAIPATAKARVEVGQEFGVDYSRGQATKNFDVQDAEQRLAASNGPEGEQMRQFKATQQEQVKSASEDFRSAFGDTAASPEQRGAGVQEAIRELRDLGQAGVNELYKQARELGAPVELDATKIRHSIEGLMAEADIPEQVKKVIEQEAARYGLIGKPQVANKATGAVTNEAGVTTVKLDDGQTIKFRGEPETLRLDNADKFRTVVSKQYLADGPMKLTQELKRVIDDVVEDTATKLASGGEGKISNALQTARKAVQEQKATFSNKDVVQDIIDWKKGSSTGKLKPEQVMQRALSTTSDLKRVKAVLLSKPTLKSKAAWRGIQAHGLATIFEKAITRNTNTAGEITEAISGAKLRSAIESFGPDKLKVLLDPDDLNKLMKLRRVIEDVTIPISGTTNPSGSGNLLMRLMADVDNKVTGAFASAGFAVGGPAGAAVGGAVGRTVGPVIKQVKEAKAAAETLKGATEYSAEKAATETATEGATAPRASIASKVKTVAGKAAKAFIETYSDPRVIAPVIATIGGAEE